MTGSHRGALYLYLGGGEEEEGEEGERRVG